LINNKKEKIEDLLKKLSVALSTSFAALDLIG